MNRANRVTMILEVFGMIARATEAGRGVFWRKMRMRRKHRSTKRCNYGKWWFLSTTYHLLLHHLDDSRGRKQCWRPCIGRSALGNKANVMAFLELQLSAGACVLIEIPNRKQGTLRREIKGMWPLGHSSSPIVYPVHDCLVRTAALCVFGSFCG